MKHLDFLTELSKPLVSAEFSELVESSVCVAQPPPRWQKVTGVRSVNWWIWILLLASVLQKRKHWREKVNDCLVIVHFCFLYYIFSSANKIKYISGHQWPGCWLYFPMGLADLGLHTEVQELVNECEQPGLTQTLPLPEDLALRHLPALSLAHRRLDFTHRYPALSSLQEVHRNTLLGF